MSMILTITNAGRQALVNAQNTGTLPLVISHVALGSAKYNPAKTQTTLQNEIKRLVSFGGGAVAPDVIHITIHDDSADTYALGEFGLITSTGVLFAVFSQTGDFILEKNSNGILLLSVDIKIATLDITDIQFSGTNFILPPSSKTVAGILKLADDDEAREGLNPYKAMTPKTTKAAIDQHKNEEVAHSWNQISNKPATYPATAHGHPWGDISGKPATFPATAHAHSWDDLPSMLPVAKLPFYYGIEAYGGYVAQRDVNGDIHARRYKGSGVELQDLNASSINSGVVNDAYLPSVQSGKKFTGQVHVQSNRGIPDYISAQLLISNNNSGYPVAIGFWNEGQTACELVHRTHNKLELFGHIYGDYGDFAARDIESYGTVYFRPAVHTGGMLNGGIRSYAVNSYNYGMGVNNTIGGLEFHASQTGAGMHRFFTGQTNDAVERMRISGGAYTVDVSGNVRANDFYGNGSQLSGLNFSQLPFIPVQQGGGPGQDNHKINININSQSKLKVSSDGIDLGEVAFENWVTNNFSEYRPVVTNAEVIAGTLQQVRQWTPAQAKLSAEIHAANLLSTAKRRSLTVFSNASFRNGTFYYWTVGNVAFCFFEFLIDVPSGGSIQLPITTIPVEHRPASGYIQTLYSLPEESLHLDRNATVTLQPDGVVNFQARNISTTVSAAASWRFN